MTINDVSGQIVRAAIVVHSRMGPGLLERAYHVCLAQELRNRGLCVRTEVPVPIWYDGAEVDLAFRIDMLVEDCVIVELKAIAKVLPVHEAQLLSHLRLSDRRVGLLINFHVPQLRDGVTRIVNRFEGARPSPANRITLSNRMNAEDAGKGAGDAEGSAGDAGDR